jgi:hypothetical protein
MDGGGTGPIGHLSDSRSGSTPTGEHLGHKKPSGKSSALAQLERWLTQLGKSGYGDYMSSHAFSTK